MFRLSRPALVGLFLMLAGMTGKSQNMLGTSLGNYAGLNGLQLNPSAMHNARTYLEIQFAGMDAFIQNNYLYIPKSEYRFRNFFNSGYQWPSHREEWGTEERNLYHYTNLRNKNAFVQTRINGPGAMLIRGRHAFALSTAYRTVSSVANVPYELANFMYLGLNYRPQQNINYFDKGPVRGSGMTWGEIGVSYSYNFYARGFNMLAAGITVKRLLAAGGMYVDARKLDYTVLNDTTVDIHNVDAELGLAIPVDYTDNTAMTSPLFKGKGFGADLGVTYTRLAHYHQDQYFSTLCAQQYEDYLYRIGVALIDIGAVRFKENAILMRIDNRSALWENLGSMNFTSIGQLLDTISYKFYGDRTSAYAGEQFTLWLPAALSLQFDYHYRKHWYVNASLVYGFPVAKGSMTRPAELSVTPRYETRWFEASMPVSLYNWQLARVGLALRVYGLTVGTDKIGGFFHFSDFNGLDFYLSLKLFFDKGNCRNKGAFHCGTKKKVRIRY